MQVKYFRNISMGAVLMLGLYAVTALAHHGWNWTVEEQSTLEGTVRDVYLGQPHASLQVEAAGGEMWTVDLAPPSATSSAGFVEGVASNGDPIVVVGNRAKDPSTRRMKAVRVTVDGKHYDVYPDRVKPD